MQHARQTSACAAYVAACRTRARISQAGRVEEQVHDRALFGNMQRDEDDGGHASGAEQPGKPTHELRWVISANRTRFGVPARCLIVRARDRGSIATIPHRASRPAR